MAEHSRAQLVGYAVAGVVLLLVAVKLLGPSAHRGPAGAPPVSVDRGAAGDGGGELYVHVAGAVRRPGLYRLPSSARVAMAVKRAGGPARRADLGAVNLAARLEDGQQIVVPGNTAGGVSAPGGATGGKVSLGSATVEQLDTLDGIGPALAKRIVDYRESHGGFRSIDDLRGVAGIGEKRLAALRDALNP